MENGSITMEKKSDEGLIAQYNKTLLNSYQPP
jgi:hypothetical protein